MLYQRLEPKGYQDDKLVFHVDCLRRAVDDAPEGLPAVGVKADVARIKQRARRLLAS